MSMAQGRSALLAEDDPDLTSILRRLLSPWRLDVVSTGSAAEASDLVRQREFDLYLIDLKLSDTDASDLLALLTSKGSTTSSRCVLVTSFPLISRAFSEFPVVDKTQLASLGPHLLRILGRPQVSVAEGASS